MPEHVNIEDPYIHEPKGVAGAAVNTVYVADGAGSGDWSEMTTPSGSSPVGRVLTADGSGSSSFDELVWKDLLGTPIARTSGATDPSFVAFRGNNDAYAFAATEEVQFAFHIPHDYAPGTNLYFHVHWSHQGTAISGNMVWTYEATYAKGHNQAIFPAGSTGTISYATVNIATTPQYIHRIDEIQISAASPTSAQIDTDDIEVDGLLLVNVSATTIPTITGGTTNLPFMLMADIHYQAMGIGTKNKAPNFYS